jgi:uncharacterized protein (DUF433 family)
MEEREQGVLLAQGGHRFVERGRVHGAMIPQAWARHSPADGPTSVATASITLGYSVLMTEMATSVQRSFRLSSTTSTLLDELAEETAETRNSLVERLLAEGLRTERHPLVRFRTGAAGRREPALLGTRLLVRQVVAQLRDSDGRIDEVADYLGISGTSVRAALSYYADFTGEVDADSDWAVRMEADHLARWEREQAALS